VRAEAAEDLPFLRALFETARPDAIMLSQWPDAMRGPFLDQQFRFQTIHYSRAYPRADRLVLEESGLGIGRLILARDPEEWCIVDIALVPPARGTGLGTLLLRAVQAAAAAARVPRVVLTVDFTNRARQLYERLGFVVLAEEIPNIAMAWYPAAVN